MTKEDQALASGLAKQLAAARSSLELEMRTHGMHLKEGWRIAEEIRHTIDGTVFIYRPIHIRFESPALERRVTIDQEGRLLPGS
jgi:hypothetical protein